MKFFIERIDIAAFGGISGKSVSFDEGVNLISAPNEGGKSTLIAAIFFALYGFRSQSHSITDNPKKKYMPWSGAAASVALTVGGSKRLRIERSYSGGKESALCTELATGLPLYAGKVYGEEILGVSAETAERLLFFATVEPQPAKDEPLAAALQNLLFSAEEQVSGEKAAKSLTAHRNALKGRSGGVIPTLEEEEAELIKRLEKEKAAAEEFCKLEGEVGRIKVAIAAKDADVEKAEAERENLRKYRAALLLEEYSLLSKKENEAATALADFGKSELSMDFITRHRALTEKAAAASLRCAELKAKLASLDTDEDEENLVSLGAKCKRNKTLATVSLIISLLLIGGAVACYLFVNSIAAVACGVGGLLAAVFGLTMAMGCSNTVKAAGFDSTASLVEAARSIPQKLSEQRAEKAAVSRALADAEAEYEACLKQAEEMSAYGDSEAMLADYVVLEKLRGEKAAAVEALASFKQKHDLDSLAALAAGATKPVKSAEQIETEYRFASQGAKLLREKLSPVLARLEALRMANNDPAMTEVALAHKERELAEARSRYAALSLAIEELTAASLEMKASVSPRISAAASRYFATATGGKYQEIELDAALYMSYDSENGVKSAEHLSTGTRDTAYLCLRMALLDLIYGDTTVSLILDDAFCRQDGSRLTSLLSLLCGKKHQLLITSCTEREARALDEGGIPYKRIQL